MQLISKLLVLRGVTQLIASLFAFSLWISFNVLAQSRPHNFTSVSTVDRLEETTWWPTKGLASHDEYVGAPECAECHSYEVKSQALTAMAHASSRSIDSNLLDGESGLAFRQFPYDYKIARRNGALIYSVGDGRSLLTNSLIWVFGVGNVGQTYIYEANGSIFESRVSFYQALNALDITTGHPNAAPHDLQTSAGRMLTLDEAQRCFGCHTTASTTSNRLDPNNSFAGVTCEACHGPGAKHVSAMRAGRIAEGKRAIQNPARLAPSDSVDFCGACHRTLADAIEMRILGKANVRFQPYRLERSRCWADGDERLGCVECHNPHEPLARDVRYYDQFCIRCHGTQGRPNQQSNRARLKCPVSKEQCVTCHMPKVEVPEMHYAFTDHWIRIIRPGKQYPN